MPDASCALDRQLRALHNIVKHADARKVSVTLGASGAGVQLVISDDGKGFDTSDSFPGHLGLRSMRERAEGVGGSLELASTPDGGRGTSVTVRVPTRGQAA